MITQAWLGGAGSISGDAAVLCESFTHVPQYISLLVSASGVTSDNGKISADLAESSDSHGLCAIVWNVMCLKF